MFNASNENAQSTAAACNLFCSCPFRVRDLVLSLYRRVSAITSTKQHRKVPALDTAFACHLGHSHQETCFETSMKSLKNLSKLALLVTIQFPSITLADKCQPVTWGKAKRAVNDVVCRYEAASPATVNYYTCSELALHYKIDVDEFFKLNPSIDRDCKSIKPNTDYCVKGCTSPLQATVL